MLLGFGFLRRSTSHVHVVVHVGCTLRPCAPLENLFLTFSTAYIHVGVLCIHAKNYFLIHTMPDTRPFGLLPFRDIHYVHVDNKKAAEAAL